MGCGGSKDTQTSNQSKPKAEEQPKKDEKAEGSAAAPDPNIELTKPEQPVEAERKSASEDSLKPETTTDEATMKIDDIKEESLDENIERDSETPNNDDNVRKHEDEGSDSAPSEQKETIDGAESKPAEDKPAEDKPAEDKPAEDKPAEEQAAQEETPPAEGEQQQTE